MTKVQQLKAEIEAARGRGAELESEVAGAERAMQEVAHGTGDAAYQAGIPGSEGGRGRARAAGGCEP